MPPAAPTTASVSGEPARSQWTAQARGITALLQVYIKKNILIVSLIASHVTFRS